MREEKGPDHSNISEQTMHSNNMLLVTYVLTNNKQILRDPAKVEAIAKEIMQNIAHVDRHACDYYQMSQHLLALEKLVAINDRY